MDQYIRTISMIGEAGFASLRSATVAVFGLGGVGGYVVEGLARCGIGNFSICDCDVFSKSNLNRQLFATHATIDCDKTAVCKDRILAINPTATVEVAECYFSAKTSADFDFSSFDYVVDAIDSITSKILLAELCKKHGVPLISCMGTGNKTDPTKLAVAKLSKTTVCPLARVMRRELKNRNIDIKVVFSTELPTKPTLSFSSEETLRKDVPSSMVFVPACAGLLLAREVVFDIINSTDTPV